MYSAAKTNTRGGVWLAKRPPVTSCSAPESTTLPYKSFLMSTSHFMMELKAVSSMPAASMPTMLGVNSTSGQRKRSLPIVITCSSRVAGVQKFDSFPSSREWAMQVSPRPAAYSSTDWKQMRSQACQYQNTFPAGLDTTRRGQQQTPQSSLSF